MSKAVVFTLQSGITGRSVKTTDAWSRSQTLELCRGSLDIKLLIALQAILMCSKIWEPLEMFVLKLCPLVISLFFDRCEMVPHHQ